MSFEFSKKFTSFIKGIAIIFMIMHHAFGFPEWYVESLAYPSLSGLFLYIRQLTVICVGIFAFITGYTYSLHKDKSYKYSLKKICSFLKSYWLVYALLLMLAVFCCNYKFDVFTFFQELFAIKTPIMNFCWYVSFYICVMLILPIYTRIIKSNNIICDLLLLTVFLIIAEKISGYSVFLYNIREYMPILLCGYIFGKYKIFNLLYEKIKNVSYVELVLSGIMLVFLALAIQTFKTSVFKINISAFSVPILIFGVYLTRVYEINILDKLVSFLGKHSMNIWFIHCVFYSRATYTTFQKFAYFPKNPILVLVWILTVCGVLSVILNYINNFVSGFFKKESKVSFVDTSKVL